MYEYAITITPILISIASLVYAYSIDRKLSKEKYKNYVLEAYNLACDLDEQSTDFNEHLKLLSRLIGIHFTTQHKNKLINFITKPYNLFELRKELYKIYKEL